MGNRISAAIAGLLILSFLGFYAINLGSIALWIIIGGVLAMVVVDFVQSGLKGNNNNV